MSLATPLASMAHCHYAKAVAAGIQWLTKPSQCFVVLDRLAWCEKMTESRVLILMYIKLHLLGFIDHVISCDLDKSPWGNEQNNIETHWDSFVSIYYFAV